MTEVLHRGEPHVGIQVARAVAEQESSEDLTDQPAADRAEPDWNGVLVGIGGRLLPRASLRLGEDIGPEGAVAGKARSDVGDRRLRVICRRLADQEFIVGDRIGRRTPPRRPAQKEARTSLRAGGCAKRGSTGRLQPGAEGRARDSRGTYRSCTPAGACERSDRTTDRRSAGAAPCSRSMKNCQSMAQSAGIGRKPPRSAASSVSVEKIGRRCIVVFRRYSGRIIECPNRYAATENSTGISSTPGRPSRSLGIVGTGLYGSGKTEAYVSSSMIVLRKSLTSTHW